MTRNRRHAPHRITNTIAPAIGASRSEPIVLVEGLAEQVQAALLEALARGDLAAAISELESVCGSVAEREGGQAFCELLGEQLQAILPELKRRLLTARGRNTMSALMRATDAYSRFFAREEWRRSDAPPATARSARPARAMATRPLSPTSRRTEAQLAVNGS
jgi:hypothetical protein